MADKILAEQFSPIQAESFLFSTAWPGRVIPPTFFSENYCVIVTIPFHWSPLPSAEVLPSLGEILETARIVRLTDYRDRQARHGADREPSPLLADLGPQ